MNGRARGLGPGQWLLVLLLCAALSGCSPARSSTPSRSAATMIVIGDSITSQYNDLPGDRTQGWWSLVSRRYDARITVYGERGAGFVRRGLNCKGILLRQFIPPLAHARPEVVMVEGGRNDWRSCAGNASTLDSTIAAAVDEFLTELRVTVGPHTAVFVLGPPWGPTNAADGPRITRIVRAATLRHGMQFVDTDGVLTDARTTDGVHPNRAGSVAIADRVIAAIGPTLR